MKGGNSLLKYGNNYDCRFATPKDTWPKMDKPGLSMEMGESKDG